MSTETNKLKDCHDTVEQLQEENRELQEENGQLRESADAFGELAERLSEALKEERDSGNSSTGETTNTKA